MDTCPITARSLQRPYHIKGDEFERAYKEFLSGYRTWEELAHAEQWLVFPENVGPHVSIDETSLSRGELYTIVANKDGHAGQGTLIAIVKGTRIEDVVSAQPRTRQGRPSRSASRQTSSAASRESRIPADASRHAKTRPTSPKGCPTETPLSNCSPAPVTC